MSRRSRTVRLRRTWPQRFLIIFNVGAILVALVGAGSLAYAKRKVGDINRVEIASIADAGSGPIGDKPRNFLIVGTDDDDGLDVSDPARAGRDGVVGGVRSDTIMVVRLDPKTNQAKVLSFPRDLWVDIPGRSPGRINTPLQFGGPDLLISTIKTNFDIDINHYVAVNFAGFKELVKLLGGVPVYFAAPVRDAKSGLNVETAGCTTLDENGALHYVRARQLKYYDEERGRWVSDPTGDLGRISRQQDFIKRVLRRAVNQGWRNPTKLTSFVNVGVDHLTLDRDTTVGDLISLGQAFRNFDPETLQTYDLPVVDKVRGGADVLDLIVAEAEPTLQLFRGTGQQLAPGEILPSTVSVKVLNGSGEQNQAAIASEVLATAGFKMGAPNSASATAITEVRYLPGQEAQAALVARHLFAQPVLIEDSNVSEITVITGEDFGAAVIEPRPASDVPVPTTSTTTTPQVADPIVGEEATSSSEPSIGATTTSTTEPTGFVPDAAPAGQACG
jgi:polyisoprenyl-teichoic acid--peptidoglycan teichoic acid transferase